MDWKAINWGSVADWVSGIGSMSAAIVAIYLSRSANKIRLYGHFGHRIVMSNFEPAYEIISIRVTNIGNRSTVINSLGVRAGLFKKRYAGILPPRTPDAPTLPKTLSDGDECTWAIPLEADGKFLTDLCAHVIRTRLDIMTFQLRIYTTNGGVLRIHAEKGFKKKLLTEWKRQNKSGKAV